MFVDWKALPTEIWLFIFNHVKDLKRLVQCRLVCKAWDPLAERALFSQPQILENTNTLTGFYNHLIRKPFLGRYINELHLHFDMEKLPFHREFLELAFTPNIKRVGGNLGPKSFKIMLDIAQHSATKYDKLAGLPLPYRFSSPIHQEIALHFRKSWQQLTLVLTVNTNYGNDVMMARLLSRLDEFESLTRLEMHCANMYDIDHLKTIDSILAKCTHLTKLNIVGWDFVSSDPDLKVWLEREELNEWMIRHVKRCFDACTVHVVFQYNPQIVEYITYKYPNAHELEFKYFHQAEEDEELVERYIQAVKNGGNLFIKDWHLKNMTLLRSLMLATKSDTNSLTIHTTDSLKANYVAIVRAKRSRSKGHTSFDITISKELSGASVEKIYNGIVTLESCTFRQGTRSQ